MSKGDSYCVKLNFFFLYQLEAAKNNYNILELPNIGKC